jgi:hypothetical protein
MKEEIKTMTLKPKAIPPVPEMTKAVAAAAFPKGNLYMQIRDELGGIYTDELLPTFIRMKDNRDGALGVWHW